MNQEKLLELYFNKLNERPTLTLVARHEAAHAIMRYLVGLSSARLRAGENHGVCESPRETCDARQQILVLLAGIACETKYSAWLINLRNSRTADLEQARLLLSANVPSRRAEIGGKLSTVRVEKALRLSLERACAILESFNGEIESLGAMLAKAGRLSAIETGAFLRQHIGPARRLAEEQWKLPLGVPIELAPLHV
jgi:hypothetical protein